MRCTLSDGRVSIATRALIAVVRGKAHRHGPNGSACDVHAWDRTPPTDNTCARSTLPAGATIGDNHTGHRLVDGRRGERAEAEREELAVEHEQRRRLRDKAQLRLALRRKAQRHQVVVVRLEVQLRPQAEPPAPAAERHALDAALRRADE